jgi:hypothetical protein
VQTEPPAFKEPTTGNANAALSDHIPVAKLLARATPLYSLQMRAMAAFPDLMKWERRMWKLKLIGLLMTIVYWAFSLILESVRRVHAGLQSFLSMRRIEARRKNASAFRLRFSRSLASLGQRLSHAMVRSTIQRLGKTANPLT